jgi:hypothetical protein
MTHYKHQINIINLRLGLIHVGAAFQPRLSDYGHKATFISRLESRSHPETSNRTLQHVVRKTSMNLKGDTISRTLF